ncbi:MAG: lamin tail domain-containing protein [Candidatus Eiseniibacteriota bacterium]
MRSCIHALAGAVIWVAPASGQVVINEVLPAPGTDWTQNGIFASAEDEWLELHNAGAAAVDVTGWLVGDSSGGAATPRMGLAGSIPAGGYLFVTGEMSSDWESLNGFPAVGLSLNNSSETVYLYDPSGGTPIVVDSLSWSGSATNVSIGRLPDGSSTIADFNALTPSGTGVQPTPGGPNGGPATPKILASSVTPSFPTSADAITVQAVAGDTDGIVQALLLLSVDGGPQEQHDLALVSGAATYGTWERAIGPYAAGTNVSVMVRVDDGTLIEQTNAVSVSVIASGAGVVLNEIFADPPSDLSGDANGDGVRDTSDDEFVEILNTSTSPIDLTGWAIHDATSLRHQFAAGPVLAAGEMYVVFGGGTPTGVPSGAGVASTGQLSLNNTADTVQLVGPDSVTRDAHQYGSEANADQSLIRVPDGSGPWTRPGDEGFSWIFSPGAPNGATTSLAERSWADVKALYRK